MKRAATFLRWAARFFAVLYLAALLLWAIGTFGWFGQTPDPLAAVFLVPLGLPWVLAQQGVVGALLAPLVNLILILLLARLLRHRATGR